MSLVALLKPLSSRRVSLSLGVWGEAGIGKTFTVSKALRESPIRGFTAHAIASNLLIARALPRSVHLPTWAERQLERVNRSEAVDDSEAVTLFATLLAALAPVIFQVEDLHDATPERLGFWTALGEAIKRTKGVGLVVTSRMPPPETFRSVRLKPLSKAASDALLEAEAASSLPRDALAWIYHKAYGNPLYTLEFFRFLARRGHLWSDAERWRWREPPANLVPVTVEALIERIIIVACGDAASRTALEARAYLESVEPNLKLEPEVWSRVAGLEPNALERAEQRLQAQGVLGEAGFAHPLFREVSYRAISAQTRQGFAGRALEVLPLELGAVFIADAQLMPAASLELLVRAAEQSKNPGRWLALAVEFSSGQERLRLALEAARALTQSDLRVAERLYRVALEGGEDAVKLEFIGFVGASHPEEAASLLAHLPEQVRSSEPGLVARFNVMNGLSDSAGIADAWRNELGSSGDLSPEIAVHVIWALKCLGRLDAALRLSDQTLARTDLSPWQRARVLNRQANVYGELNLHTQALALTNQLLDWLERHGLPGLDVVLHNRALDHKQLGDYQTATRDLERALPLSIAQGHSSNEMLIRSFLGSMHCEFGEYALAEEFLLEAHEYQALQPVSEYLLDTLHNLTELYTGWRERPSSALLAQKYARLALERADHFDTPPYLAASRSYAGLVELEYGHPQRALDLALEAQNFVVEGNLFFERWLPTWLESKALAALGDQTRARALLEPTVQALEQMGRAFEANQARLDLARLQDDLAAAQVQLGWFRERGLLNAVRAGLRLFPELAPPQIGTETPALAQVVPELQVLGVMQIAASGQTAAVRGQKRKELLLSLLEARILGRSEVTALELFDALYPNVGESEAASALKQTVFKLRSSYGPTTIITTANGYALGAVTSDAETFLRDADTRVWRGPYLRDANLEPSASVLEVLILALHARANALLEPDPGEAARIGRLLLETDPYDVPALHLTCRALRALGHHRSLSRIYLDIRAKLLEVDEFLPPTWQAFLLV